MTDEAVKMMRVSDRDKSVVLEHHLDRRATEKVNPLDECVEHVAPMHFGIPCSSGSAAEDVSVFAGIVSTGPVP